MDISKQLKLMEQDMQNEQSDLYQLVFSASGMEKQAFIEALIGGINAASESSYYGSHDTVYAAYTYVNGRQIYFKFSAPKEEMNEALGSAAPFLGMFNGGVYLAELPAHMLLTYVMPFYYREVARFTEAYAQHPAVKKWSNFMVSVD